MKIIFISGTSGSGKNTFVSNLGEKYNFILPETTRPPRVGEVNGKEYIFIDDSQTGSAEHDDVAAVQICNAYQGSWKFIFKKSQFSTEKVNICIAAPIVIEQIIDKFSSDGEVIEAEEIHLFVDPETRINRMLRRGKDAATVKEVCRRYLADDKDFAQYGELNIFKRFGPRNAFAVYSGNNGNKYFSIEYGMLTSEELIQSILKSQSE